MIVDYHMHLRNRREEIAHDTWSVDPFVDAARAVGVDEIGFTEHVYYFKQTRTLWTVPYQVERCVYDLESYVDAIAQARARGLPVKLGLEVDYVRGREDETRALLAPYPWDYLLGSVHFIDGLGVDGEPRLHDELGVEEAWRRYFDSLADAARSGLFDSLSHPDLVKVFGDRVPGFDYRPIAEAIADSGVAVEVSTAGLRKPVGELYPHPDFLVACREHSVPVTTGSDAHSPDLVGRDFDRARELLHSAGYETVTVFERRSARQEPIE
ncbi:MAG TPA: histidinol-phosphatase HisJ family protein [Gaiellaceae bacterium]|nr:histidinol-phosphatase HisJ family protein [Gaiellaceae bacterium]